MISWCGGKVETLKTFPHVALIRKVSPLRRVGRARSLGHECQKPFHVVIGDSLVGRLPLRLRPFAVNTRGFRRVEAPPQ